MGDFLFHGTSRERGKQILETQKMFYSEGDGEWLGDGIYLYRELLYAYRWLKIIGKKKNLENIFDAFMILQVEIECSMERIFSFINPEHQIEFKKVKEECLKKQECSEKMQNYTYNDGVVLNIMFKKMDYAENYDAVEALFPLSCSADEKSRLNMLYEYQLCVKNPEIIHNISDCTSEVDRYQFENKIYEFNEYRSQNNSKEIVKGNKYNARKNTRTKIEKN